MRFSKTKKTKKNKNIGPVFNTRKGKKLDQFLTLQHIYIYGPHLISWADILHFWHFLPSFIVKNAPILQPTNCGCKFVFLLSSFSLLLPFSALFFLFFLCFYKSQSLKTAHQLRCALYIYIYTCMCFWRQNLGRVSTLKNLAMCFGATFIGGFSATLLSGALCDLGGCFLSGLLCAFSPQICGFGFFLV